MSKLKNKRGTFTRWTLFYLVLVFLCGSGLFGELITSDSILSCAVLNSATAQAANEEKELTAQAPTGEESESKKKDEGVFSTKKSNTPTFIRSDNLTLRGEDQVFVYTGNVHVKQGDMTLTADTLEGKYNEKNEIQQLIAKNNVVIVKGAGLKATSQRAVYESVGEVLTLTENPELQQDGSVLTADIIRLFLDEDRSAAEGAVRVKMIGEKAKEREERKKKQRGFAGIDDEAELSEFEEQVVEEE